MSENNNDKDPRDSKRPNLLGAGLGLLLAAAIVVPAVQVVRSWQVVPAQDVTINVRTIDRLPAGRAMFAATSYLIRDRDRSYLCEDYANLRGDKYCRSFQVGRSYLVSVKDQPSAIIAHRIVGLRREL